MIYVIYILAAFGMYAGIAIECENETFLHKLLAGLFWPFFLTGMVVMFLEENK